MHTGFVLVNLLLICSSWKSVLGFPFKFLPRIPQDRIDDQRRYDKQLMLDTNNLLSPLTEYDSRPSNSPLPMDSWIKITQNPVGGLEVAAGSRVELECKASGSPPPEMFWFAGTGTKEQLNEYVRANTLDLYESGDEWKGIGRIVSKLVIDCVTPEDAGLIYCAAVSPKKILISKPTVLIVNGDRGHVNCSEESEPTITLYSPTRVANIGSTIILPCRATGRPAPEVTWMDNYNVPLSLSTNSRHRILDNGDLLIENLVWEDMGGYTCKASSGHHAEVIDTFLYPLRPDNEHERTVN